MAANFYISANFLAFFKDARRHYPASTEIATVLKLIAAFDAYMRTPAPDIDLSPGVDAELRFCNQVIFDDFAAKLHDALSQNLAGIALELKTIDRLRDRPELAQEHLKIADRSLLSCREELRNCLYDLRSAALEEKTLDAAIRKHLLKI